MKFKEIRSNVLKTIHKNDIQFTIGIIATKEEELKNALDSLNKQGFNINNTEFIIIKNIGENHYDCYRGISLFIDEAIGDYLIVMHQDVTVLESFNKLKEKIDDVSKISSNWAIIGNSGFSRLGQAARRISDPYHSNQHLGSLPAKVSALDENLLIINMKDPIYPTKSLSGFHLYGTDLCFRAQLEGRDSFVIDWHVYHASKGNPDNTWKKSLKELEREYDSEVSSKIVQIPTTVLLFGMFRILRPFRKTIWRIVRYSARYIYK